MRRKGHVKGLAGEVAEASRAKTGRQAMQPNELVATARTLERLLQRRRKLRVELRRLDREVKAERRNLKALAGHYSGGGEL